MHPSGRRLIRSWRITRPEAHIPPKLFAVSPSTLMLKSISVISFSFQQRWCSQRCEECAGVISAIFAFLGHAPCSAGSLVPWQTPASVLLRYLSQTRPPWLPLRASQPLLLRSRLIMLSYRYTTRKGCSRHYHRASRHSAYLLWLQTTVAGH